MTPRRTHPLLIVNTGEGKGKSTAAFGIMMRSWAKGWDVGVYQFLKSEAWKTGERKAAQALHDSGEGGTIAWFSMGDGWTWVSRDIEHTADLAREGWEEVKRRLADATYDTLICDELTYAMTFGWIDTDEVVEVLTSRPGHQHVVITGRDAPQALLDAADLVSEVTKRKHPYDVGITAQEGIEW